MSSPTAADLTAAAAGPGTRRHGFGLQLDLADGVEAPDLPPGEGTALGPPTAVRLCEPGEIDARWRPEEAQVTRTLEIGGRVLLTAEHAPSAGYLLTIPGWGRFLVDGGGASVACEPAGPGWAWALAAQALPLAATLRGLEPFHASAVALGGAALMLTAPPGLGKTSLAAHLVAGGASLLTDDVLALEDRDGAVRAHPGSRWLHVRPVEAGRLPAGDRLVPVEGRDDRVGFAAAGADGDVPLRAIYLLERGRDEDREVERLDPVPPTGLLGATYNLSVREPGRLVRQLALCQRLAATVPVFAVRVRPGTDAATLAARLRDHFTDPGDGPCCS